MLKCLDPSSYRFQHLLHLPSGVCLLCLEQVLPPVDEVSRCLGATDTNVPQPIPVEHAFPRLAAAWKSPILPPLEYISVKKHKSAKPPGVTIITPGPLPSPTPPHSPDLLALHFFLEEDSEAGAEAESLPEGQVLTGREAG